jgi:hypothetical protein
MSNALAIATVTATLKQIVEQAAQSVVDGARVRLGRPDTTAANQDSRIYLYLYQVTPNAALRNADLPSRDSAGKLTARPQAALELHYLLAFCGEENDLTPERMMGAVVRDLHARPIIPRELIERLIGDGGDWHEVLGDADLHQAVEQVRLTPVSLLLDDQSKLWSVFFQTPHARCLTYRTSVVLIDAVESGGPVRPVLRRGKADRGVQTQLGPFPHLTELRIDDPATADWRPRLPSYPAARLGWRLTLKGSNLGGDSVQVEFQHLRLGLTHVLTPASARADEIIVDLPAQEGATEAERWPAGLYSIQARITRAGETYLSNMLPLALAPHITQVEPTSPIHPVNGDVKLILHCVPAANPKQDAVVFLAGPPLVARPDEQTPDAWSVTLEKAPTVSDELVYLRVAGVNSMPFKPSPAEHLLVFDEAQMVTIT